MDVSFSDLIRGFIEYSLSRGRTSFPGIGAGGSWHKFLYRVMEELRCEFPFLPEVMGRFDWDGPFPKNPKLFELFPGIISWCQGVRFDGRLIFTEIRGTGSLSSNYPKLFQEMYKIASEIPGFFVIDG